MANPSFDSSSIRSEQARNSIQFKKEEKKTIDMKLVIFAILFAQSCVANPAGVADVTGILGEAAQTVGLSTGVNDLTGSSKTVLFV